MTLSSGKESGDGEVDDSKAVTYNTTHHVGRVFKGVRSSPTPYQYTEETQSHSLHSVLVSTPFALKEQAITAEITGTTQPRE